MMAPAVTTCCSSSSTTSVVTDIRRFGIRLSTFIRSLYWSSDRERSRDRRSSSFICDSCFRPLMLRRRLWKCFSMSSSMWGSCSSGLCFSHSAWNGQITYFYQNYYQSVAGITSVVSFITYLFFFHNDILKGQWHEICYPCSVLIKSFLTTKKIENFVILSLLDITEKQYKKMNQISNPSILKGNGFKVTLQISVAFTITGTLVSLPN